MSGDAFLIRDGPVSVPLAYVVPQSGELLPLSVRATLNGASSGQPYYAVVQLIAPSGHVLGNYITDPIAAGASADVTWFSSFGSPAVGGSSGGSSGPPPPPSPPPTPSPPPPPTPPPVSVGGDVYVWDATKATVRPNSAQVVPIFVQYGCQSPNFTAEVGVGVVEDASTQTYEVTSAGKPGGPWDAIIHVPNGTGPGLSTDGHYCIVDKVRSRWHDFELFHDQGYANGKLTSWTGGCSMPLGSLQEPKGGGAHGGATVAKFPLRAGLVTTDDVKAGAINHALVFTATNLGPAPNPYPANTSASYQGPNVAMPLDLWKLMPSPGTWLRLSPSASLSGLSSFERMVAVALQRFGMFCRDRSTDFALHGMDLGGQGQSYPTWHSVGVPLSSRGQVAFSSAFRSLLPELQVLEPPAHA